MDAQARIDEIKAKSRERSKRYYDANKEKIAARRKLQRDARLGAPQEEMQHDEPPPEPMPIAPVPLAVAPAPKARTRLQAARAQAAPAAPVAVAAIAPVAPVPAANTAQLTLKEAAKIIGESIENVTSRRNYISSLKTVVGIIKCKDLRSCFNNFTKAIKAIESSKQRNGKDYKVNSKKQMFQSIVKLTELLGIDLSEDALTAYHDKFQEYKILSNDQTQQRKAEEVMDYKTYLALVKKEYGELSKEFIVASLYYEDGFRDDLQLKIVRTEKGEPLGNLLVVPDDETKPLRILLQAYKTSARYGPKKVTLSNGLSKLIKQYIAQNEIPFDSYLFGNKSLSRFVSDMNKQMDLKITINTLRHMGIASILSRPGLTAAERAKLAKKYNHSPWTNESYARVVVAPK